MQLTLDTLKASGAFTGPPVLKSITWQNEAGESITADVYVRRLSFATLVDGYKAAAAAGFDPVAQKIASCICDAEGKPVMTAGDVNGEADPERGPLCAALTEALLAVIGEVNGLGKKKAKPKASTKSGTNSSSTASAGAPSRKPKNA